MTEKNRERFALYMNMWKSKLKKLEKIFKKHLHYVANGVKLRSVDNKTKTTNKKIKTMNNQARKNMENNQDYEVVRLVKKNNS